MTIVPTVRVRRFARSDADAVLALFAANDRDRVDDPDEQGFVQGRLDAAVLEGYHRQAGLWVADNAGQVVGFACAARDVPAGGPPPTREIARRSRELRSGGVPLAYLRWVMYGPVVIDSRHRGQGVARSLFAATLHAWAERAEVAVAFVEDRNRRSLGVHVHGLGMSVIGGFVLAERAYTVLAIDLRDLPPPGGPVSPAR